MDMFSWHLRANNILLPNSKWKIVQKKIKTILSFMTHLSGVTISVQPHEKKRLASKFIKLIDSKDVA